MIEQRDGDGNLVKIKADSYQELSADIKELEQTLEDINGNPQVVSALKEIVNCIDYLVRQQES